MNVKGVSDTMTCNRYEKLLEMIHFNDNSTMLSREDPQYDKLHKIRPLIEHLNSVNSRVYNPSQTLSVDESMIPFSGRSSIKQYIPMKPVDRGYKVWCSADAKTGFITKMEVYTDDKKIPLGKKVVMNMVSDLRGDGYLITFDNFFTSVDLIEKSFDKGMYSIGTVRSNRKGLPSMMKKKDKMERGEYEYLTKGHVAAIKWMDKKPVTLLESAHNPKEIEEVKRTMKNGEKKAFLCPKSIKVYNEFMGGVDKFDQLRERYMIGRRSRKWWHPMMYYFIDMAIINSYILYQIHKKYDCGDQLSYRISLGKQLIGDFNGRKRNRQSYSCDSV